MENRIKRIEKILDGNGQPGLVVEFAKCKEKIETMDESLDKLATAYSALAKNDSNREAVRKALGKGIANTSLIVGIFATIITLLVKLI